MSCLNKKQLKREFSFLKRKEIASKRNIMKKSKMERNSQKFKNLSIRKLLNLGLLSYKFNVAVFFLVQAERMFSKRNIVKQKI